MGFGLLVIGYMMLFNVPFRGFDIPPDVIGYILILASLLKIGKHTDTFKKALYTMPALFVLSLGKIGVQYLSFSGQTEFIGFEVSALATYLAIAEMVLQLPFYILILTSARKLADSLKLPKTVTKTEIALFSVIGFDVITILTNLYIRGIIPQYQGLSAGAVFALQQLFGYALRWIVLIAFISCYMNITYEGYDESYKGGWFEKLLDQKKKGGRDK